MSGNIAYVVITGPFGNGAAPQIGVGFSFTIVPPSGMPSSGQYGVSTEYAYFNYGDSNEDVHAAIKSVIAAVAASNSWPTPDHYQFVTE